MSSSPLNEECLDLLSGHELFHQITPNEIHALLSTFPLRTINGGETLITAGKQNNPFYLIIKGKLRVHLLSDLTKPVVILQQGQSIGEMAIIDNQASSTNIIADIDSELIEIEQQAFWQLMEQHHQLAINMLQLIAKRLSNSHSMFEKIKTLIGDVERSALIDPLTNLYNRRWLDNMLPRMIQRTAADGLSLAVIMLDIDYFKRYNDEHGHLAGDRVLQTLASAIKDNIRPEDFVTRYGGEEFFIILPGLNVEAGRHIAERLRDTARHLALSDHEDNALPNISISLGLAELDGEQSMESLVALADDALYAAKTRGRNCIYY